ncbi:MAG: alcohol dehydrogenase [Candidatus Electrothrix sp. AUS1_2]|nr:alcohol dehydrogenase [Candidatus Electrothrix sp. AUS1_2]
MQGIWLEDRRLSLRADLPVPVPGPGEALIRVLCAGICATDLQLLRGYYPYTGIPGHEFVGRVEQGPPELLGQRVVGEINVGCGHCSLCGQGLARHCRNRTVPGIRGRNGAFAEYLTLPCANLHHVPANVSTEAAVFTEPLAAALQIQEQVAVRPEDRVLVLGDGKLGLLVAQTLALTGCRLLAVGRHEDKLALLSQAGIAVHVGVPAGQRFDLAVECTGSPEGFASARNALRPRGTLILKSTYTDRLNVDASALVVDEITVIGSRCGPFAKALELLAAGKVAVEPLIRARYPLSCGLEAFALAGRKGSLKVLLEMGLG